MVGQDDSAADRSSAGSAYRERNSTADRALEILQLFRDDRLQVTGNDVADHLSVARSTAYRYLQSLTRSGFVEESETGGYRLGPRVLELARLARKGMGLSEIARPVMRQLLAETSETVLLTRRSGAWVVCLELEESQHPVRLSYERGHLLPANAGAAAYVLLAWADDEEIDEVLASNELPHFTPASLTSARTVHNRLREIRQQGWAISRGELDPDVVGIAAPIRDESDTVVAAISIAGLARRIPASRVNDLARKVRDASEQVSQRLRQLAG